MRWLVRTAVGGYGSPSEGPPATTEDPQSRERLSFVRPADLPGVEVIVADNCARRWVVAHETYTVCTGLTIGRPAAWRYRSTVHEQTGDGLMLMEPGEVHANVVQTDPASFRVLMIDPAIVEHARRELGGHGLTHFKLAQTDGRRHPMLRRALLQLHSSLEFQATSLERQERFDAALRLLLMEAAEVPPGSIRESSTPTAAIRARDYIEEHLSEPVALETLVRVAGSDSRFSLVRSFTQRFGIPPHAYQLSRRIARASRLLADGLSPATVALEVGFADQSHFGRHFVRAMGIPPRAYQRSVRRLGARTF